MYRISDQQLDFMLNDIRARGITIEPLRDDLLDHICIIIEQHLDANGDFEQFYTSTVKTFYKQELREIEEETRFLLTYSHHLVLGRNTFFLLLFTIFIGPFIGYDLVWLARSGQTTGWHLPVDIWGPTLIYALFPLLILLVLFLTPERLDPLIPKKAKILVGLRPFIRVVAD